MYIQNWALLTAAVFSAIGCTSANPPATSRAQSQTDVTPPKSLEVEKIDANKSELVGTSWSGEYQGGTIRLAFKNDIVTIVVNVPGINALGNKRWQIDANSSVIRFDDAVAKRDSDAIVVSGNMKIQSTTYVLKDVRLTRF